MSRDKKEKAKKIVPKMKLVLLSASIAVLLAVILIIGIIFKFVNFRFSDLEGNTTQIHWQENDRMSLLLVGLDQVDERSFVDFLAIVILDPLTNELKVFNINPNLAVYNSSFDSYISFKSFPTYSNGIYNYEAFSELNKMVEGLTTVKTHGYIIVTKDNMADLLKNSGNITILSPSNVLDKDLEDLEIKEGEARYKMEDLLLLMAADENGIDDRSKRQNSIISTLFNSNFWLLNNNTFQFVINPYQFQDKLTTNISIPDMLKMYRFVYMNNDIKRRIGYVQINSTYKIDDPIELKLAPIYETLDADLQKILLNREANIEQLKIDILNSTDQSGVARVKSRWLKNRGIRVVITGNTEEKYINNTLFISDPENYPNTINEIKATLKGELDIKIEQYPKRAVGNAVLVIGENELD